jgi:hypothetical protein
MAPSYRIPSPGREAASGKLLVTWLAKNGNIHISVFVGYFRLMAFHNAAMLLTRLAHTGRSALVMPAVLRTQVPLLFTAVVTMQYGGGARGDAYNMLWAVVFGFATLNILGLAARHLEPTRRGLSVGEMMAVAVVIVSLFLLGWEMLNVFHVFPIKLKR